MTRSDRGSIDISNDSFIASSCSTDDNDHESQATAVHLCSMHCTNCQLAVSAFWPVSDAYSSTAP